MSAPLFRNDYQVQNVFLGKKFFTTGTYTNSTGSTVNLVAGQLMGRILATGLMWPTTSTNTDGSEMPRFLCGDNYSVAAGATVTALALCTRAEVNESAITLNGGDTLASVVRTTSTGGGTLRDLLLANTEIMLIPTTELTNYDN